ncbi:heme-binding protein [Micromonospora sp. DR5-3]|uniref:GlcG/HbpS family heme-binding protein n=1 Tax=unclassified Micromonospora TaxID=2617518 RepID=UPI0011D63DD0|nr:MULTISPECIES: heme-binding protein [unclassified Micromonospora]MCW3818213.1 heme-binding protein [Micromonospora sp. DR5-3]TYC21663.1 heme-binding protein [Micromonospora sp. MP36]
MINVRRRATLGLIAGAVGVAAVTGVTVNANAAESAAPRAAVASKGDVVANPSLDIDAALSAAEATLKAAEKGGHRVTVVVLDRSGDVQVQLKGDGAGPQTAESATRKAFTAVSFGQPTSALSARVTGPGATLRDIPGTLFLAGGVPVSVDGQVVGAIGVGGAPSGDLDEQYANAGANTLR